MERPSIPDQMHATRRRLPPTPVRYRRSRRRFACEGQFRPAAVRPLRGSRLWVAGKHDNLAPGLQSRDRQDQGNGGLTNAALLRY